MRRVAARARPAASAGVESRRLGPGRSRLSSSWRCSAAPPPRSRSPNGAKLELEPDLRHAPPTAVSRPTCNCDTSVARIDFRLRKRRPPHRLARARRHSACARSSRAARSPRGPVPLLFDGISEDGLTLADGAYRPVVRLARRAPDDRAADRDRARHEPAGGARARTGSTRTSRPTATAARTSSASPTGSSEPGARAAARRRPAGCGSARTLGAGACSAGTGRSTAASLRAGNHVLQVSAQDPAGNRAKPFPFAVVQVRYVDARPDARARRAAASASRCSCSPTRRR